MLGYYIVSEVFLPCYTSFMKTEYEAKFLNISIDEIRTKLEAAGAVLEKPMRLMRRVTIDTPFMKQKDAFMRVRDEGDRVTMTYKQFDALSIDGAKEYEVTVSDFDETVLLLAAAGLVQGSFQESKRETWTCDNVEIVIDEWPWLKPYIEIEAQDKEGVRAFCEKIDLRWADAVFGDVMTAYRAQYPHLTEVDTVGNIPEVRFGTELPELFVAPRV